MGEPAYDFLHFYCKCCYSLIIYLILGVPITKTGKKYPEGHTIEPAVRSVLGEESVRVSINFPATYCLRSNYLRGIQERRQQYYLLHVPCAHYSGNQNYLTNDLWPTKNSHTIVYGSFPVCQYLSVQCQSPSLASSASCSAMSFVWMSLGTSS